MKCVYLRLFIMNEYVRFLLIGGKGVKGEVMGGGSYFFFLRVLGIIL